MPSRKRVNLKLSNQEWKMIWAVQRHFYLHLYKKDYASLSDEEKNNYELSVTACKKLFDYLYSKGIIAKQGEHFDS